MEAQSILAFAPLPDELDLWPLLASATASGKSVFLPKYDSTRGEYFACPVTAAATEMSPGRFGILEPPHPEACAPLNRLDLALVPGVAFDLHGHRLGRGKGFYDRLLKTMQARICGVAYDEQLVDHVPAQPHDVSMNFILTPSRWIQV